MCRCWVKVESGGGWVEVGSGWPKHVVRNVSSPRALFGFLLLPTTVVPIVAVVPAAAVVATGIASCRNSLKT